MIGRTLLHYRILENLGEGGMGVVYKALDTHLDRLVAIKVLPPERIADIERKRRFVQEAKSASALNHPNIITIYDIASENGVDFIAMEYVPGKPLDRLISRKGLALGEVLKYSIQISDALAAAHAAGIIHRDLKPSNVMVRDAAGRAGVVKVPRLRLSQAHRQNWER
jgi:serine/threonine protein kinase